MAEREGIRKFKGRPILPGDVVGEALVTHLGFNAYASFYDSLSGNVDAAVCADAGNDELYGKRLNGKIICLPQTIGSTSAGAVWQRVADLGLAPKAMLFSKSIDSLAAGGLIVADVWTNVRIVTVDQLGEDFLIAVESGGRVHVGEDGTVVVRRSGEGEHEIK